MKKSIIAILILSTSYVFGQTLPKYGPEFKPSNTVTGIPALRFSKNDKVTSALQFVAGFSNGLHEAIQARHWGNGKQFWDNQLSWKNKYKADGSTERFPGSTTIFVSSTDGYHLTNLISNSCNIATLYVGIHGGNKSILRKLLISVIANRAAFYLSYNQIFK